MSNRIHAAATSSILLAALALASCGGGGGGGGGTPSAGGTPPAPNPVPTALLALTATNAQDVASGATLTGLGASSLGPQFQQALVTQPALPRTHILMSFVRQQIARLTQNLQSPPTALIAAATMVCGPNPGDGTVTLDQSSPTSAVETFTACTQGPGQSVTGTITFDNMNTTAGVSFGATAGINLTFSQTGSPDVTITGSNMNATETVNVSVNTVTLSGTEIFTATNGVTERLGTYTIVSVIDASSETDTLTFNYASTKIGGSVDVTTTTACVTDTADSRNFPHAGVLSLAGAGGSKMQVTINGDETFTTSSQVTIGVDANGDGTFETTISKNWADLSV